MSYSSKTEKKPIGVLECTIENFAKLDVGSVTSDKKLELMGSVEFRFMYSKTPADDKGPANFALFLKCGPNNSAVDNGFAWQQCAIEYQLDIIKAEGDPFSRTGRRIFGKEFNNSWGWDPFVDLETLLNPANKYVVNNELKLVAKIYFLAPSKVSNRKLKEIDGKAKPASLYEKFLEEAIDGVVTFIAKDGGKVQAHLGILIAASPVFKAMFEVPMTEAKSREIDVDEMGTEESVRTFLKCVYTGSLSHLFWVGVSVLKDVVNAAEKYGLEASKNGAAAFLFDHCSPENAIHLLQFAKRYGLKETEKSIREYIKCNIDAILDNCEPLPLDYETESA